MKDVSTGSQLTLTDFRGSAWKARFTLQDVHDTLEAYLPEKEEDLLSWIRDAYCSGQPKLIKEKGKLSGMVAKHMLKDLQVDVSLKLPPNGNFEELTGQAALEEYHGMATSLCKSCEQAHARSRQLLEEKEDLCTELTAEKEKASKLYRKLQELQPGVKLTATGSFKRPQDVGQASQAAARAVAASQITQPQDVDSGNGSAGEGQHDRDPGPTTPQSRRKVGEALTVRGRGRGRHAPAVQKGARSG
ncbi:hypothetical protein CVIRNUC_006588 [Coccomyxa viridis]|uniref:Uncharacterized protein n=1 Tax=Coccomyxa viridis TaxID=1274662 RepID=A0AAV1I7Q8_9CHLO|nr:hypothetical protein CVIRNUC_006588 [Coccomyxa viridis]